MLYPLEGDDGSYTDKDVFKKMNQEVSKTEKLSLCHGPKHQTVVALPVYHSA